VLRQHRTEEACAGLCCALLEAMGEVASKSSVAVVDNSLVATASTFHKPQSISKSFNRTNGFPRTWKRRIFKNSCEKLGLWFGSTGLTKRRSFRVNTRMGRLLNLVGSLGRKII
jgi:hypothetical protein